MNALPEWLRNRLPKEVQRSGLAIAALGDERGYGKGGLALKSPAFADGEDLDPCFTADEEDAVAPPLEWTAPPPMTQEFALIVENASPGDGPGEGEAFCHWLVWGIPPQQRMLLEGEVPPRTGKNSHGNSEWLLPEPPHGETHHYLFQLYALDLPLTLMPGADRAELIAALEGHVIASATLVARYTRSQEDDGDWEDDEIE